MTKAIDPTSLKRALPVYPNGARNTPISALRGAVMAQHARIIQSLIRDEASADQIHSILTNTCGATFAAACDETACSVEIMGHVSGAPGGWTGAAAQWAQDVLAEHGDSADQCPLAMFLLYFGNQSPQHMHDIIRAFTLAWGLEWQDGPAEPGALPFIFEFLGVTASGSTALDATRHWLERARTTATRRVSA